MAGSVKRVSRIPRLAHSSVSLLSGRTTDWNVSRGMEATSTCFERNIIQEVYCSSTYR